MDYLSLCLICKDENDYLAEWLDYHILMGVDRFYIYDNESQVSLRASLAEYIERGWVVVVDIAGKAIQLHAYDHCLQTFGAYTRWLGFIDTDEFLVPKTTLDLKELLKEYESYGGLVVSSLFFGSNGHRTRPGTGQIAAYTRRTHPTFKENELVKSIVQPALALMPTSPHNFTFKEGVWCVNEGFLRVDYQRFPNYTAKIQLNHYYCRSEAEIDRKLRRGRGDNISAWSRKRFDVLNQLATYEDKSILQNLELLFQKEDGDSRDQVAESQAAGLLEKMTALARGRRSTPLELTPPRDAMNFRAEFIDLIDLKAQLRLAGTRRDFKQSCQLLLRIAQIQPQVTSIYIDLMTNYLNINDLPMAWQALTIAWQLAPNTYMVLASMSYYFLKAQNFSMAEKTSHLVLEIAPHNLIALGILTEALIGQGRYDEAVKIGLPLIELSAQVGELPDRMGIYLVKKMADYLLEQKDYASAARLWQAGVQCQPGDVNALLELTHVLLLEGDNIGARQYLAQAQSLAPRDEAVLTLLKQVGSAARLAPPVAHRQKRRH